MEKIWLQSYPPGVPAEIDPAIYGSLVELLEQSCQRYAGNTAFISMGATLSYAELDRQSRAFAAWLQSRGLARGDRVALMMPNLLQYPIALFGVLRAGCVVVNCNPLYTPRELEHQLADAEVSAIVIAENFAHTLAQVQPRLRIPNVVVTSVGDQLGALKGRLVDFVVRRVKRLVPAWQLPGALAWRDVTRQARGLPFTPATLTHDDLAFLQYTGGTTGVAKAAMLSHGNMVANLCQAHAWVSPLVTEGEECIVTALPLYHIFALTANCLTFMRLGASNLLILNPRDIGGFIRELSKTPFTCFTGVNTLFNALLNHPDFDRLDFSRLRITLGGGMAVQRVVAERWLAITGTPLAQAYGLTEASPAVSLNPLRDEEFHGSVGLPVPSLELSVRDKDGNELEQGQVGEVCIRGPQIMRGYWRNPEETAQAFHADGYLRTGDIGYVDHRGFLYLVDRKKDLILVSGFNVYPTEIEDVAAACPGVREVAAVGWPDAHSGEVVKLFVIRSDPQLNAQAVIAYCRKYLTGYKVPRAVEFRDDLPRTNVGKILRRELRPPQAEFDAAQAPAPR
ncbi:long-chain-fatty-acid--CoA ligase [Bordetella genomosp. 1]|uniref:Long-chain-fatty-acid--CoA ligase n=1 Tax=Bordetella genomosp. 1 TaxID=1395607 RepID=A0A261S860_9BORD|nr:AMP-binding protein [Bordetella genomosp. 1]OZI32970.1 long-chain-fatty-acid--CoA ligase [Bordetella genomosp. 1]